MSDGGKGDDRRPEAKKGSFSKGHDLIRWPSDDEVRHNDTPNETCETPNETL